MKNVINEAGLYRLVMRSTKTEAKAFQKWVTGTVLPAIRKNGGRGETASGPLTIAPKMSAGSSRLALSRNPPYPHRLPEVE